MAKCSECGKEIKFVHNKKDKVKIPVDMVPVYFVPPNGYDRMEIFINAAGYEVKGCRASDGMFGYKRHEC